MEDWIIEADIYRYRKELAEVADGPQRRRLLDCLTRAETRLAESRRAVAARGPLRV